MDNMSTACHGGWWGSIYDLGHFQCGPFLVQEVRAGLRGAQVARERLGSLAHELGDGGVVTGRGQDALAQPADRQGGDDVAAVVEDGGADRGDARGDVVVAAHVAL